MDNADEYLRSVVAAHSFAEQDEELLALRKAGNDVKDYLRLVFGSGPSIRYGGSHAKRTMVRDSYDLDVLCYFACDDSQAGHSLKDIYLRVKEALEDEYVVTTSRSSLRIMSSPSDDASEYTHIDVVPGRFVNEDAEEVFLHQNIPDAERLKTNPEVHIVHVRNSGLRQLIKLVKVWRHLVGLEIRSFVLELLVIEILPDGDDSEDGLDELFKDLLVALRDKIDDYKPADPANSSNDLRTIYSEEMRRSLREEAARTLDLIETGDMPAVFGEEEVIKSNLGTGGHLKEHWPSLRPGDTGHCVRPPWPEASNLLPVSIRATVRYPTGKSHGLGNAPLRLASLSDGGKNCWLTFLVSADVKAPYEVLWQVVNTGAGVPEGKGRGDRFEPSSLLSGLPSRDKHLHEERALYVGRHWVQCFYIRDGLLVARSDRVSVRLLGPPHRRFKFSGRRRRRR